MALEVSFYLLSNFIHHKIVLSVSTVNPFPVMKTGFHNIHIILGNYHNLLHYSNDMKIDTY